MMIDHSDICTNNDDDDNGASSRDSPQATDVGINRNELQPQNSPNKFGPQTFILSHAPDFHPE